MDDSSLYLKQLKYDPKLENKPISKYLRSIRLVMLVLLFILTAGVVSYIQLPRRLNPEIKIPIIIVNTTLPGAGPADVESLITIPLEDEIKSVDGIDTVSSNSSESVSSIIVEFTSSINIDKALNDVQRAVDSVNNLPDDSSTPSVNAIDFEDTPILTFAITSDSNYVSLSRYSDNLKDELESIAKIDRVQLNGNEDYEIQILVTPEKLRQYDINPIQLGQIIESQISSYPSGIVNTESLNYQLTIDSSVTSVQDIRDTYITINNIPIKLGDIADISEKPTTNISKTYVKDSDGEVSRATSFSVYKTLNADIDDATLAATEILNNSLENNTQFELFMITDTGKLVSDQFNELSVSVFFTVLLVFITLFVFLGIRQALVASLSIPLTFLVSFIVMNVTGLSLNFLSLFSLLLALGLVVDDAIVIISAMTQYNRTKKFTPIQTGLLVWNDYSVPIWTTTLTTVWAFLPLLLATGLIGEFIKSIPIVVSSTLIASTMIAVFITLPIMIFILSIKKFTGMAILLQSIVVGIFTFFLFWLLPKSGIFPIVIIVYILLVYITYKSRVIIASNIGSSLKHNKITTVKNKLSHWIQDGIIDFTLVSTKYKSVIESIIQDKKKIRTTLVIVILFSVFSYALVPLGFVKNEFFPKTEGDSYFIQIELPVGTVINVTEEIGLNYLNDMKSNPNIDFITMETGKSYSDGETVSVGDNYLLYSITLIPESERTESSLDMAQAIRDSANNFTEGTLSVIEESGGPPAGSDIQIKFFGDDLDTLDTLATATAEHIKMMSGTNNVQKSLKPSTGKLSFIPNNIEITNNGLTMNDIGFWMRTFTSGYTIDSVRIDDQDEIDVILRTNPEVENPELLGQLYIPSKNGQIPISSLGNITLQPNLTQITREDGKRTISVSASVNKGFTIPEVSAELEAYVTNELVLPTGYTWETGGVNEENNRSVQSIIQAMGLSALLILATMVIQLGSFRKSIIVLMVIPLAISGVFIIFAITGTPLSFPALIGILALFGIVVNNSIVLVDKINQNIHVGMNLKDSIVDASASRIEPIAFSSLTTIIGLVPITLTDALWRGLGGAIIAGLTFSGTIMLFFIPAVYYIVFNRKYSDKVNS